MKRQYCVVMWLFLLSVTVDAYECKNVDQLIPIDVAHMLEMLDMRRNQVTVGQLIAGLQNCHCGECLEIVSDLEFFNWQPNNDENGAKFWIIKRNWEKAVAIGSPSVAPLIAALQDSEWEVRRYAAQALVKIGTPSVTSLIAALQDSNLNDVRLNAAQALIKIGTPSVAPLIAALQDSDNGVRQVAAQALGEIKDHRAVTPLIAALQDSDSDVRRAAAQALGEIKDPRAVTPLIAALQDSDSDVRRAAAQALGEIKDPRAVTRLIAALQDSDSYVRQAAAQALVQIGSPSVTPLIAALQDSDSDVRQAAAQALELLGWHPQNDENGARFWIAKQDWAKVVAIGLPSLAPLITALQDSDSDVRQAAAQALGEIKNPLAMEPLIATNNVREVATNALITMGPQVWIQSASWKYLTLFFLFSVLLLRGVLLLHGKLSYFFLSFLFVFWVIVLSTVHFEAQNALHVLVVWIVVLLSMPVMMIVPNPKDEGPFELISFASIIAVIIIYNMGNNGFNALIKYNIIAIIPFLSVISIIIIERRIQTIALDYIPVFVVLTTYLASWLESWLIYFYVLFLLIPLMVLQLALFDGLLGLAITPWWRTRKLPKKQQWLCQDDHYRPVLKGLPWLTRWTNRHIYIEQPALKPDFVDAWHCPVCNQHNWDNGIKTVVGTIGIASPGPSHHGDSLYLPLFDNHNRPQKGDIERIEVSNWPADMSDANCLNSIYLHLSEFAYAATRPLNKVPIHLGAGVNISNAGRIIATNHFGGVVERA